MSSKFEASILDRSPRPLHIAFNIIELLPPASILNERIASGHADFRIQAVPQS